MPCEVAPVAGAFYYLIRVDSTLDSMTLIERLIREHKVATIPGSAFADAAPCSIRISYGALEPQLVTEGVGRLVKGLQALAELLSAESRGPARHRMHARHGTESCTSLPSAHVARSP